MTDRKAAAAGEVAELILGRGVIRWSDLSQFHDARYRLNALIADGCVIRISQGVYASANVVNSPQLLDDIRSGKTLGKTQRQVLDLLSSPRTAPELVKLTSLTRQAIHQSLEKLRKSGLVCRYSATGDKACWLYLRSNVAFEPSVRPSHYLNVKEELLLNSIPSSGTALLSELRAIVRSYSVPLKRLVEKGLVLQSSKTTPLVISLTRSGIDHPQYRPDARRLRTVQEETLLKPEKLALLLALETLGTAGSRELELATGLKRSKRIYVAQLLGELKRSGWTEQLNSPRTRAIYRLADRGKKLVAKARANGRINDSLDKRPASETEP